MLSKFGVVFDRMLSKFWRGFRQNAKQILAWFSTDPRVVFGRGSRGFRQGFGVVFDRIQRHFNNAFLEFIKNAIKINH
jgi:hypothetical protein